MKQTKKFKTICLVLGWLLFSCNIAIAQFSSKNILTACALKQLSTEHFRNGFYFYKIINEEGQLMAIGKLIKQ